MSSLPLAVLSPSTRSLEWLVGPNALLSSTALSTGQLASLGPIASIVEGTVDGSSADATGSVLPDAVSATANQAVLDTHAQLEVLGHEVAPLNGPLHGLTTLGETAGLGHIGHAGNLITDFASVVANPASSGAVPSLLGDAGSVTVAAGTLLESVTAVAASGNGLIGAGGILSPATSILNQAVLDLHTTLEGAGHQVPVLNAPVHAVTALGETLGLGYLGQSGNLLTDTIALPGSFLTGGDLASSSPVLADLGPVLGSADTLIGSITGTAGAGGLLSSDGLLAPVTNLANTAILDIHATLENIGHGVPVLNDALHGLTNLGERIGLGYLGQSGNLLTDVAALPGELLGGQGPGALSPILNDVGAVTHAAGGLLGGVTGLLGGLGGDAGAPGGSLLAPVTAAVDGVLGGHDGEGALPLNGLLAPVTSTLHGLLGGHGVTPLDGLLGDLAGGQAGGTGTLLGANAPLQPVAGLANGVIDGIHGTLEQAGHDVAILNEPLHAVINLGTNVGLGELGEAHNLLTDVVNLPGAVLGGNAAPAIGQVVGDVGHVADAAGGVLGSVTGALSGAGGGQGGAGPLDGVLGTVISVLGTTEGGASGNPVGGLLGGLTGGGSGDAGTGTHPLIDVAAGPTTATPLANAAVLTPAADPSHTVQASAIAVGADQPSLATASLLSGDSILLPQSGGGAADALVGQILSPASAAPARGGEAGGSHGASLDLGIVTIDLGSHADIHHTDPTPHSTTGGLHLLGL